MGMVRTSATPIAEGLGAMFERDDRQAVVSSQIIADLPHQYGQLGVVFAVEMADGQNVLLRHNQNVSIAG